MPFAAQSARGARHRLRRAAPSGENTIEHTSPSSQQHAIQQRAKRGFWSVARRTRASVRGQADVVCFAQVLGSGPIRTFRRLDWVAEWKALQVCKHTTRGARARRRSGATSRGVTMPERVEGHQQTAYILEHDILTEASPIAKGPHWGTIDGPGRASRSMRWPWRRRIPAWGNRSVSAGGHQRTEGGAVLKLRLDGKIALVVGGGLRNGGCVPARQRWRPRGGAKRRSLRTLRSTAAEAVDSSDRRKNASAIARRRHAPPPIARAESRRRWRRLWSASVALECSINAQTTSLRQHAGQQAA